MGERVQGSGFRREGTEGAAVVVPDAMREDLAFYETVCRNNAYSVSIFFDQASALNWLKS